VARHESVDRVDGGTQAEDAERDADPTRRPQLCEERDASAVVARDRRAVGQDEPPAVAAAVRRDRSEQALGLGVLERQEGERSMPVDAGDEPRRPAAEPSAARVQQHRAREHVRRRRFGAHWH
jgi:hypothetical protein